MQTHLKFVRLRRGIEAKEVASALGITKGYYSKLENFSGPESKLTVPTPALAEKIAVFFGRDVTEDQILYPYRYLHEDVPSEQDERKAS